MNIFKLVLIALYALTFSFNAIGGEETKHSHNLPDDLSQGKVKLIFFDALCPMPQFPGCEEYLSNVNSEVSSEFPKTFMVFNTLYVDKASIKTFVSKHNIKIPIIIDGDMALHDHFEVYATPYLIELNESQVLWRGNPLIRKESAMETSHES
ncbi:hypothetical protein QWI17_02235 [Gilvimarinus sp. SDUM040013]|uniref:Alkyl hydroperoxide reductase subunit C/ Thiol specific antioxidant domain-containing protein n=1 Tax=Gilvimarinus gilvus TaxID=3058038 RepID=A0ABU4S179_9GAMM|nr:hypothetical protein [Gilvimarinus sp. SDUM040013]MDO3384650.1 hypothetical protein [Gilvimarinus sp. SDUM040013]MDX6850236.1 hypothetical protein [Gilvimarinus sp. SDUM040013]